MFRQTILKSILLFIFVLCDIISSKKLLSSGSDVHKQDKLNECARCKVLSDSFNHWLKKTSRGKYEGGDTAWEESKLKSYARSEIRLVEIQEGLCSELSKYQDYCYSLSEEAEQVLEKWWFHEDPNSVDLYMWLCIETLKYCCPEKHFGLDCTPCPLDKNDNICSSRGKCDGDGTREGNGTCICKKGFIGKHCEECAENFFPDGEESCAPCHRACVGCSAEGPAACHSCKHGWQLDDSGTCVDIDECLSPTQCEHNELCVNREGNYRCKACDTSCATCTGLGVKNCSSCDPQRYLWGGMCITRNLLEDILIDTVTRLIVYVGIAFIIAIIMVQTKFYSFRSIFLIGIVSVLTYNFETRTNINTYDAVMSIYENYNYSQARSDFVKIMARIPAYLSQNK